MTKRGCFSIGIWLGGALLNACATSVSPGHATDVRRRSAVVVLESDSILARNPDALYQAAMLRSSPHGGNYNPDHAARLLSQFVERFPADPRRAEAAERLALVHEILSLRHELRALKDIDLARPPR